MQMGCKQQTLMACRKRRNRRIREEKVFMKKEGINGVKKGKQKGGTKKLRVRFSV